MYVIIDGKVYDPEKVPVAIGFQHDQDRWQTMSNIQNMEPQEGVRVYMVLPDHLPGIQQQFELEKSVKALEEYLHDPTLNG